MTTGGGTPWVPAWVRWLAWLMFGSLWSVALLIHSPAKSVGVEDPWAAFLLAKTLHVSAYLTWTVLGGWLGLLLEWHCQRGDNERSRHRHRPLR